jgi:preprotein translocase subunit SecB
MTDAAQGQQGPVFGVVAQYLKDLSFESPRAPDIFLNQDKNPQVSADVKTEARPLADGVFEVELLIAAKAMAGDDVVFQIECLYAGVFQVQGVPEQTRRARATGVDQGHARFVTRGFNTQDQHRAPV